MSHRPLRSVTLSLAALATTVLVTGCSSSTGDEGPAEITLTPRAVAAIALDVLDETSEGAHAIRVDEGVGAELTFDGAGAYRGDRLQVTVRPTLDGEQEEDLCAELDDTVAGCEQLSKVKSTRLWLTWTTETPSTDPGYVLLTRMRGGETSTIEVIGPVITGDPRTVLAGDRFTVPAMQKVLEDPRLDLVTSDAALLLGDQLRGWQDTAQDTSPETARETVQDTATGSSTPAP